MYGKEHLYLADYIIQNKNDIKKVIDIEIFQKNVNSHKNNTALKKYVEKFFFSTDGYRCSEYAKYLRSYMKDNPFNSEFRLKWFLKHPNHSYSYFLRLTKSNMKIFLKRKNRMSIEEQVNKPSQNNERPAYELQGSLVDAEYGLFDNRMQIGDEQIWYRKFEDLKL